MLVFRDGRRAVPGRRTCEQLAGSLQRLGGSADELPEALLRAGELECALADAASPAEHKVAELTDSLATALIAGPRPPLSPRFLAYVADLAVPERLTISTPEGFAYYGLQPRQYAAAAAQVCSPGRAAAVVGIRSIGTTLSAMAAAGLRTRGDDARRITVRPTGHPWDRRLELAPRQARWVGEQRERGARFLVVDEGPGLSGSSFLAAGEALVEAGVPAGDVVLLCASLPDPGRLRARHAAERVARFRWHAVQDGWRPPEGAWDLSAGQWRGLHFFEPSLWPASWTQFERRKFLSPDRRQWWKFEGLGRHGRSVVERAAAVAAAGFGPPPEEWREGYAAYALLPARPASSADLDERLLSELATYCAFRASDFPANEANGLAEMVEVNFSEEFGSPPPELSLTAERPVIADGRMQPHEWLLARDGRLSKTDAAAHGDDHFYPGPVDIAWDLAGAIVEWELVPEAVQFFLARYRRLSGDDPTGRLPAYLLAYTLFRMGHSKMAAESVPDPAEAERLRRDYLRYRALAALQAPIPLAA